MDKVKNNTATVLACRKIIESPDGTFSIAQISNSFQAYLAANRKTEKPILHISLNPDPNDKVSDATFRQLAEDYMQQMGYGEQPFAVFKHSDIKRAHIHIVSVCVDEQGRKISDTFEKRRSMDTCRMLELKYALMDATQQSRKEEDKIFRPVDYQKGDVKSQIAAIIRYLPKYYKFQSFGAYNALLSGFNITAEEIKGEYHGNPKQGIVYFATNTNGVKVSNPFKASLFGKSAGYAQLQTHYKQSAESLKIHPAKDVLKSTIEKALYNTSTEAQLKNMLLKDGINTVARRNSEGRLYGMTFVDHNSKTVWNGSQLGKEFSANVFNDLWNNARKPEPNSRTSETDMAEANRNPSATSGKLLENEGVDSNIAGDEYILSDIFSGSMLQGQGEDYEEEAFARRMKKKSRGRNR